MCVTRKETRLVVRIVHVCDQDAFEGEVLLLVSFVIVASRKQCLDVVTAIDRHDPIANLVSGTVQRNGQPNLQTFFTQVANLRRQPAGLNRNVARADTEAPTPR